MPYRANGICFATTEQAFQSWSGQFPVLGFDNGALGFGGQNEKVWVNSIQSHTVNSDGSFTYVISHFDGVLAPQSIDSRGTFESCVEADLSMSSYFQNDLLFVVACVFVLGVGFLAGLKR